MGLLFSLWFRFCSSYRSKEHFFSLWTSSHHNKGSSVEYKFMILFINKIERLLLLHLHLGWSLIWSINLEQCSQSLSIISHLLIINLIPIIIIILIILLHWICTGKSICPLAHWLTWHVVIISSWGMALISLSSGYKHVPVFITRSFMLFLLHITVQFYYSPGASEIDPLLKSLGKLQSAMIRKWPTTVQDDSSCFLNRLLCHLLAMVLFEQRINFNLESIWVERCQGICPDLSWKGFLVPTGSLISNRSEIVI